MAKKLTVIAIALILALLVVRYAGDDSASHDISLLSGTEESPPGEQPSASIVLDDEGLDTQHDVVPNDEGIRGSQSMPESQPSYPDHQEVVNDSTESKYRVITTENVNMFFALRSEAAAREILHAAEEQEYDFEWSSLAMDTVNKALEETGVRDHSSEWTVDCHSTICVVEFPDSALSDYDTKQATRMLEVEIFERVIWYKRYKDNIAYLFVMLPEFSYDRGSG